MQFTFHQTPTKKIAVILSQDIIFDNAEDAAELLMNCLYQDSDSIILYEYNLPPAFFDLKTKLAGDILQKFSTYNGRLAIIGDFSKYESKSLKDFIYESNKQGRINFVSTMEEAQAVLSI
ncbi:DUF4180 domain-containing protein [Flavobacterium sp. AG291]|uniref:DUF4180 domain-containing protein n=1 Tax=Flavobacterium sp. AG291 TaxID=2184000 RepID=UPI000E0BE6E9|nr:DUF4180 domain-containing protein [Flavobacterium sp. AG291]RDI13146.1 uncharacterized protein DUF4180 [Flavobacterium sp. AG291]